MPVLLYTSIAAYAQDHCIKPRFTEGHSTVDPRVARDALSQKVYKKEKNALLEQLCSLIACC